MAGRHLTTAVTMVVLIGILVLGLYVGFRELFAPLPGVEEPAAEPSPTCETREVQPGQRLRTRQVPVNVFNGGNRDGLAGQTLETLSRRGFRGGEVGNAPNDNTVKRVQVWIVAGEEAAGRLVARNFGPKVPVVTVESDDDLAEGIDVVVGNGLRRVGPPVRSIRIRDDSEVCVQS